ncbi:MAG: hypothetical protein U9N30_08580 [Campylobacterota bacterium]|nr:hypothetical protein [Campylobacterota bacterium]
MKIIQLLCVLALSAYASEYYAKLEPINTYVVKSAASGEVIFADENIAGKTAQSTTIVKIDSKVNRIDLDGALKKLKIINSMISIENKNYEKLKKVSTKSAFEKDAQRIKVLNLQSQAADLKTKVASLRDQIKKKTLTEKNRYIYSVEVKKGDYVNPGSLLYIAKDLSKGKLEIFLPIDTAHTFKEKSIYINGVKSDLKIDKIYAVADAKHISSYKCEIIVPNPKTFSKLIKIEFK